MRVFTPGDCEGKVRFESAMLAKQVSIARPRTRRVPYRCGVCGGWHLGTTFRKAHQNRRRRHLLELARQAENDISSIPSDVIG